MAAGVDPVNKVRSSIDLSWTVLYDANEGDALWGVHFLLAGDFTRPASPAQVMVDF